MAHVEKAPPLTAADVREAIAVATRLRASVREAVEVPGSVLEACLVALLAEGHVLIEDPPGLGKTSLARALAAALGAEFARIQCTADLLPADIVGVSVFVRSEDRFAFRPGPLFANVVLADELNRASPRTQSGLLEAMEERSVSVDGRTHELARPFVVLATQNPAEFEGTYPLTEAQLDRFMVRVSLGYPSPGAEAQMLAAHAHGPVETSVAVGHEELLRTVQATGRVRAEAPLRDYVVSIANRTRSDSRLELGASPRAGLMLLRAAKARALLAGRDHALPDDVQLMAGTVLSHRLRPATELGAGPEVAAEAVADAVAQTEAL